MRDGVKILLGLLVFLTLVLFPVWLNLVRGRDPSPPELQRPTVETRCVEDTSYMRTEHMQLLVAWRDDVVRENQRIYTAKDHREYYKSLSGTCMGCHTSKSKFCDRCHDYVGAKPYCWDCHVAPREDQ